MDKLKKILFIIIPITLVIWYIGISTFSKYTGTICIIRGTIGVPCPSCGITRALSAIINGDIKIAFYYHPLFWLPFIAVILCVFNRKSIKMILIISLIIFLIVYVIRMVMYFPDTEPMKYNNNSVIEQFINM